MFSKEVKRVRPWRMVKDVNGQKNIALWRRGEKEMGRVI